MSDTNTNNSVQDVEENKMNLVKISARISQKIDSVIRDMATEYGVSFSEVVRLAIDGHLEQYLGQVQYMDMEQGRQIRHQCAVLGTEMQAVRNELNRIGVNVNQLAKWTNIEAEIVQLKHSMAGKDAKQRMEIASRVKYLQQGRWGYEQVDLILQHWNNVWNDMRKHQRRFRKHYGIFKGNTNCKW